MVVLVVVVIVATTTATAPAEFGYLVTDYTFYKLRLSAFY